ncbi:hypothetical protein L1987_66999 [Smallanthus sonchifolius]|uniref:Uncharacterized protein n=1 Tax=Smallanthus sonchifolius TaxID=185202 RepID=A0ACB9BZ11_9ASTR|nr:hypothetical protein L1987_66999 [Smallanthus sonchifolius]
MPTRPILSCQGINRLSEDEAASISSPFSLEEIRMAVWDCGGDKAPGPDGFNFTFIKQYWELLQADFQIILGAFYEDGVISGVCSSSFIALIPKSNDPDSFNDFRPISLIGCICKVISKVLANRIKTVIGSIILESQTAFLAKRNILDGSLVVNEILSWLKKSKLSGLVFKIDFNKAFDSISWGFIDSILHQTNFPHKWRLWVKGVMGSAKASVLINGSPSKEFNCSRGVRQGDPLSPFLFLIAMESLNWMLESAGVLGVFRGLKMPKNGPIISHLLFADDVIIMGEWSKANFKNLLRLMRCFYLASGLVINLSKCSLLGINVSENSVAEMAEIARCQVGQLPFSYLGLKVGANMNHSKNWRPIIEAFKARLSIWKAKNLSIGGRVVLLRFVLDSLPVYYFSLFKAPDKVINKLEKIRRNFLWGGDGINRRIHWVKWDTVCSPKSAGGLSLGSLKTVNQSLLAKWWWRFISEGNPLWEKVILSIHGSLRGSSCVPGRRDTAGVWGNIKKLDLVFSNRNMNFKEMVEEKDGIWTWRHEERGGFSVRSMRRLLSPAQNTVDAFVLNWCSVVPLKVNIFAWRAELDRIPTRQALSRRKVSLMSDSCPLCSEHVESVEHLFTSCFYATMLWGFISSWCVTPPIFVFSIRDILELHKTSLVESKKNKALQVVILAALWCTWKLRNQVVFDGKKASFRRLCEDLKCVSYLWAKNRNVARVSDWETWCSFQL